MNLEQVGDARRIVISKDDLNVNDMQSSKSQQVANIVAQNDKQGSSDNTGASTPKKGCTRSPTNILQSPATPSSMQKSAIQIKPSPICEFLKIYIWTVTGNSVKKLCKNLKSIRNIWPSYY